MGDKAVAEKPQIDSIDRKKKEKNSSSFTIEGKEDESSSDIFF